jgi:hypothetical protein
MRSGQACSKAKQEPSSVAGAQSDLSVEMGGLGWEVGLLTIMGSPGKEICAGKPNDVFANTI